jgi:hypothetical protein
MQQGAGEVVWESLRWILKAMNRRVRRLQWSVSYDISFRSRASTYICRSSLQARR